MKLIRSKASHEAFAVSILPNVDILLPPCLKAQGKKRKEKKRNKP